LRSSSSKTKSIRFPKICSSLIESPTFLLEEDGEGMEGQTRSDWLKSFYQCRKFTVIWCNANDIVLL
jgi:hypothetical protein